jgi:large subunit ribosomal protein L21
MPCGIRPSNVRVCHFTTRAKRRAFYLCQKCGFAQGKNFPLLEKISVAFFAVPTEEENFMAYAVIQTGGKQYRVAEGDVIEVEKLDVEAGAETKIEEVLLVSNGDNLSIGAPLVQGASVTAEVLAQDKADKVIAFKFKRRKGYHRTVGHRRQITRLKIKSITA